MSSKTLNQLDTKGKVLMEGYLRKLKTMKKKYFVVRGDVGDVIAALEYYDSEKKYRSGHQPKRTIQLKMCFNINRRMDTKHKHVIALYTKDDVFCIVLDNEKQLEEWLRLLLLLQSGGEDVVDGVPPKPIFEHTWKVTVQDKGLGASICGPYYLCLSDLKLCLVKVSDTKESLEFPLTQIRSCGETESFFYMEVGRQSITGAGELWMHTDDPNIAKNMSVVIQRAFTKQRDADPHRKRSCSATEMNRPPGMLQRRLTQGGGGKPLHVPPYSGYSWNAAMPAPTSYLPPPTVSISPPIDVCYQNVAPLLCPSGRASLLSAPRPPSLRRHSVSAVSSCTTAAASARSAVVASTDVTDSPATVASAPSTVISHQRTKSCPVTDTSISVTDSSISLIDESHRVLSQSHVYVPHPTEQDRRGSGPTYRRPLSSKSTTGPRERCDSMPSRNRTSSESAHKNGLGRPSSMQMRGLSYSPPGPYSTDSAGSSLSIDETEHAATPDENTILEENGDESLQWPPDPEVEAEKLDTMSIDRPPGSMSLPLGSVRKVSASAMLSSCGSSPAHTGDYMPMSPAESVRRTRPGSSPSANSDYLPMSPGDITKKISVGSPSSQFLPFSPGDSNRTGTVTSSPSNHSDYMPMSPSGRASNTASMDYLPMSPSDSANLRLARRDEGLTDDGYVPMAPAHSDDGYVDMDPPSQRFLHDDHPSDMSPGSSCSMTSGTPLSDHYPLEKVSAYFPHSEEEENHPGRPTRTYSFGSQTNRRVDIAKVAESSRVRAFSMGNQQRPVAQKLATRPTNAAKFSSAPLLSSSWSGSSRAPPPDPMADLMEIDYSKKTRGAARFKNLSVAESIVNNNNSSADSGYMDMSSKSPPRASPPKALSSKHLFSPPDSKSSLGRKPPHVIASSTLKTIGERPDMKPQKFPTTSSANNLLAARINEKPYVEMRGRTLSGTEGYMEMTPGKMSRKNSSDSMVDYLLQRRKLSNEGSSDYVPMSYKKHSSQPIAIVAPISPTLRSNSVPPQPPNYLAFEASSSSNICSSIRKKRKNRKKVERRDSKENMTTPTGVFPLSLNSPQSPKKSQSDSSTVPEIPNADPERVLRVSDKGNSSGVDEQGYALMRPGAVQQPSRTSSADSPESLNRLATRLQDKEPDIPRVDSRGRGSTSSEGNCESCRLRAAMGADAHSGVSRQVSTSSSSSTEVVSIKEGVCGAGDINYAAIDHGSDGEDSRSSRPSPAPSPAPAGPSFTYAEIDFQKTSESLRAPAHSLRKIRH